MADPWVLLTTIALATERIKIGTMVTPLARRRPWKLARETVPIDRLCGGRLILGVGLGVPPDREYTALGEESDDRHRAQKLDEGLDVLLSERRGPFDVNVPILLTADRSGTRQLVRDYEAAGATWLQFSAWSIDDLRSQIAAGPPVD